MLKLLPHLYVSVVVYCLAPTTKLVGEGDGEGDQVLI